MERKSERIVGIDVCKIFSMYLIIMAHVLGVGGILQNVQAWSANYLAVWFLEGLVMCSINCFALSSGFLMYGKKFRYRRGVSLLAQTTYHTLLLTAVFSMYMPEVVNKSDWIKALFPALFNQYWYLTKYMGLFLLIPFLNMFMDGIDRNSAIILVTTLLFLFSAMPMFVKDVFNVGSGYSLVWLIVMYFIGACIQKFKCFCKRTAGDYFGIALVWLIITWGLQLLSLRLEPTLGRTLCLSPLTSFISPTLLMASVSLFAGFLNLRIENKRWIKGLACINTWIFSVYIIHANPYVWNYILCDRFLSVTDDNVVVMLIKLFVITFGILILCILLDGIRSGFFRIIKIDKMIEKLADKWNVFWPVSKESK